MNLLDKDDISFLALPQKEKIVVFIAVMPSGDAKLDDGPCMVLLGGHMQGQLGAGGIIIERNMIASRAERRNIPAPTIIIQLALPDMRKDAEPIGDIGRAHLVLLKNESETVEWGDRVETYTKELLGVDEKIDDCILTEAQFYEYSRIDDTGKVGTTVLMNPETNQPFIGLILADKTLAKLEEIGLVVFDAPHIQAQMPIPCATLAIAKNFTEARRAGQIDMKIDLCIALPPKLATKPYDRFMMVSMGSLDVGFIRLRHTRDWETYCKNSGT